MNQKSIIGIDQRTEKEKEREEERKKVTSGEIVMTERTERN